jgi:hypothetical protein
MLAALALAMVTLLVGLEYAGWIRAYFLRGGMPMAERISRVALVKTENRKEGVAKSIAALNTNPVKGKNVLIKPNFNTADATPGSTHNDTLAAWWKRSGRWGQNQSASEREAIHL